MSEKHDSVAPVVTIHVLANAVHVHDLTIARPAVSAYLQNIAVEKQEIAFVHALEVGVTELAARRERSRK